MGVIQNAGVYFTLGWQDISKEEAVARLISFCPSIGSDKSEICWECGTLDCIVKNQEYGVRYWYNKVGIDKNFYNIQLVNRPELGWTLEYQVDCGEFYLCRMDSKSVFVEQASVDKMAAKVREQLNMPELVAVPFADAQR